MTAQPTDPFRLSTRARRARSSVIRDLLAHAERPDVLSLAGGLPAPDTFPMARVGAELAAVLADLGPAALQYARTEGVDPLRAAVAERASEAWGRAVGVEAVLVTSGSQQGLDLVGRVLLDPGDVVVIDDPGYLGAVMALRSHDARLVGIPVDADGLRTDVLEDRLRAGLRPRLSYTNATFQNPTGAVLAPARRAHLAELAERYDFLVVEDDPYGELWFDGPPPAPVAAGSDRVVALGTGSKLLAPGLRVAWAVGPPAVVAAMTVAKQSVDLQTGTLAQHVVARLLADRRFLDAHLDLLRATYRDRAHALSGALAQHLPDVAIGAPRGGMFLWAAVGEPSRPGAPAVDTADLLAAGLPLGVAVVPGFAFAVDRPADTWARLSFATVAVDRFPEAARRLAAARSGLVGARSATPAGAALATPS
jgi:2-aminoadipate transaminase